MTREPRSHRARQFDPAGWPNMPALNASLGDMLYNKTGGWRYLKPKYEDKTPNCQNVCPAGNDIEAFIALLLKDDLEAAYRFLIREEPFPSLLGRVCFRFCEAGCNRIALDDAVNIQSLERYLGDRFAGRYMETPIEAFGPSLAVVGSGPAGMSAAYYGRMLGFKVTILEKMPVLGGVLRVGIPRYRLPREAVAREFDRLAALGVELKPGQEIGRDLSLTELRTDNDFVFLASGAHQSLAPDWAGSPTSDFVFSGLDFLGRTALGDRFDLGARVLVIGGGNTAIDAARTAIRLGAQVTVAYRRSEKEMPAHPEEIQAAREEGVVFHFLVSPEEIETTPDGKVQAVVLARMDLGEPDESGRRRPVKRPGDVFAIEADTVITAIGERPGLGAFQSVIPTTGSAALVDGWLQAATPNDGRAPVFAGGDMIEGPRTVVHAVAAGKKAALVMDMIHKGLDVAQTLDDIRIGDGPALSFAAYKGLAPLGPGPLNRHKVVTADQMVLDYFSQIPRVVSPETKPEDRIRSFDPTIRGLSEAEAARAAERCLHCGRCTMCHNCLIFCPDVSILLQEKPESGYEIDYDYCKGCGICQAECPRRAITLEEEESGGEGTF